MYLCPFNQNNESRFAETNRSKSPTPIIGEIILFKNVNLTGDNMHVFNQVASLGNFNDAVSSFVILKGNWTFFQDVDFKIPYPGTFGPGIYLWVEDYGIANDMISSLRAV